jgi:hypothetical protein
MAANNLRGNTTVGLAQPIIQVTENLSRFRLQAETDLWRKKNLIRIRDKKPNQLGTYLFFQILNHRSPEGIQVLQ